MPQLQRVMRVWDEVHPYNAAQVLHLAGTANVEKLVAAWNGTLLALGLGRISIAGSRFNYLTDEAASPQPVRVAESALMAWAAAAALAARVAFVALSALEA